MASTSSLLRAMTYNIRFDQLTPRPNFSILNWTNLDLNPWLSRRLPFSDVINSKSPALLGIQEAKAWQANDLSCLTGLNWLGEGRDVSHSSTNNFYHTNVIQGVLLAAVVVAGVVAKFLRRRILRMLEGENRNRNRNSIHKFQETFVALYAASAILYVYDVIIPLYNPLTAVKGCSNSLSFFWGGPITLFAALTLQTAFLAHTPAPNSYWSYWGLASTPLLVNSLAGAVIGPFFFGDESSAIYFDKDKVEYVGGYETTWLNDNNEPGRIASEWGSGCTRVASHGLFRTRNTNANIFRFVNTHLDHVSEAARRFGATAVANIYKDEEFPTILTGDMNSYAGDAAWYTFNSSGVGDSYFLSREEFKGPMKSYNAFSDVDVCGRMIDFIWVSRDKIDIHNFHSEFYEGQISDHNPVWVDFEFYEHDGDEGEEHRRENYKRRVHNCYRVGRR